MHNDKTTLKLNLHNFNFIYFSSFLSRWLDKLGLAARLYHSVIVRQTFVRGHYSLLDEDLNPNPVGILKAEIVIAFKFSEL